MVLIVCAAIFFVCVTSLPRLETKNHLYTYIVKIQHGPNSVKKMSIICALFVLVGDFFFLLCYFAQSERWRKKPLALGFNPLPERANLDCGVSYQGRIPDYTYF